MITFPMQRSWQETAGQQRGRVFRSRTLLCISFFKFIIVDDLCNWLYLIVKICEIYNVCYFFKIWQITRWITLQSSPWIRLHRFFVTIRILCIVSRLSAQSNSITLQLMCGILILNPFWNTANIFWSFERPYRSSGFFKIWD